MVRSMHLKTISAESLIRIHGRFVNMDARMSVSFLHGSQPLRETARKLQMTWLHKKRNRSLSQGAQGDLLRKSRSAATRLRTPHHFDCSSMLLVYWKKPNRRLQDTVFKMSRATTSRKRFLLSRKLMPTAFFFCARFKRTQTNTVT